MMVFMVPVCLFVASLLLSVIYIRRRRPTSSPTLEDIISASLHPKPPGPKPWPLIGSLHLLGQYEVPFEAFTALSKIYGDIYNITLGATPCVVVNSFKLVKEVLIAKGAHFGGRPDFIRFHQLFGGDRNNSLALCDWSSLQKTRRSIARVYCSPRFTSTQYDTLNMVGCKEMTAFISELKKQTRQTEDFHVKPLIMSACANMFTQYMCSTRFDYADPGFQQTVRFFDEIFWEINQGYAVDFLPWLLPIYRRHMRKLSGWAHDIRQFILSRIIEDHRSTLDYNAPPRDFTDALLIHLEEDPNLNWEHIIFELEDFLGGHSAIGNLVMITLSNIVQNPHVAKRIQDEIDTVTKRARNVNLFDKPSMPYTEATILETLRICSSPIVPHVAMQDTDICGFGIPKGTVVFINNYELNTGDDYWQKPKEFQPERFISIDRQIVKPAHFIPFSTGKRTCIGQRLVQGFAFVTLASILQHFSVFKPDKGGIKTVPACVAVPPDTFALKFVPRALD